MVSSSLLRRRTKRLYRFYFGTIQVSRSPWYCSGNSLDRNKVAGKIVVCDKGGGDGSFLAGGEGVVGIFSTPCDA
jgi:hypothetical protein